MICTLYCIIQILSSLTGLKVVSILFGLLYEFFFTFLLLVFKFDCLVSFCIVDCIIPSLYWITLSLWIILYCIARLGCNLIACVVVKLWSRLVCVCNLILLQQASAINVEGKLYSQAQTSSVASVAAPDMLRKFSLIKKVSSTILYSSCWFISWLSFKWLRFDLSMMVWLLQDHLVRCNFKSFWYSIIVLEYGRFQGQPGGSCTCKTII